ncbi:MAG: DNA-binding IscR family transcriptional regulator [Gammaproteobacteria bacterium]|jgi:DNA-binding IscR family transcriptional regulator
MNINELKKLLNASPEEIEFDQVMQVIEDNYIYTPSRFTNGNENSQVTNEAGCNEGSCKIFSFAQLNNLNENQTLACFGKFYRQDVLDNPHNNDHANIRNFIKAGWNGIQFDAIALAEK